MRIIKLDLAIPDWFDLEQEDMLITDVNSRLNITLKLEDPLANNGGSYTVRSVDKIPLMFREPSFLNPPVTIKKTTKKRKSNARRTRV